MSPLENTTKTFPTRADVVVVGGGIIGLAVAHELIERGRRVVVLDDEHRAGNSTHAAAGMLAPAAEADIELPGLCEFRQWSHSLYPEFVAQVQRLSGIDCGLGAEGTLLVALDRDHVAELERLRRILQAQGIGTQPLGADAVAAREPAISSRVLEGLWLSQDLHVDQRRLVLSLRAAIAAQGGWRSGHAVVDRVSADGEVAGQTSSGEAFVLCGDTVVLAAGSWTNVGIGLVRHLPLRPVKGQLLRLHAPDLLHHVVRTPEVYLVPHADGDLVVGATVEDQGFDARPTAGAVLDLLRHAWRAIPSLHDLPLREIVVGFRPCARDHRPLIGRVEGRVLVATGHYRNGILLAPGTARMIAALVCDDPLPALLTHFDPRRYGHMSDTALPVRAGGGRS